jgi:hypothetical protein
MTSTADPGAPPARHGHVRRRGRHVDQACCKRSALAVGVVGGDTAEDHASEGVKDAPFGRGGGRPARCGRYLRPPSSLAPPAQRTGHTTTERHPACQFARVRESIGGGPRTPSHQSSASTPRVQGRSYVASLRDRASPPLDPLRCGLRSAATGYEARCGRDNWVRRRCGSELCARWLAQGIPWS